MVSRIKTIYPTRLNKGAKFKIMTLIQQPLEGGQNITVDRN